MPRLNSFTGSILSASGSTASRAVFDAASSELQTGISAPSGTYMVLDTDRDLAFTTGSSDITVWDMSPWPNSSAVQLSTANMARTNSAGSTHNPTVACYDNINQLLFVSHPGSSGTQSLIQVFDVSDAENPVSVQAVNSAGILDWADLQGMGFVKANGYTAIVRWFGRTRDIWATDDGGIINTNGANFSQTNPSGGSFQTGRTVTVGDGTGAARFITQTATSGGGSTQYGDITASSATSWNYTQRDGGGSGKGRYANFGGDMDAPNPDQVMSIGTISYWFATDFSSNTQTSWTFDSYTHRGDYRTSSNAGDRDVSAISSTGVLACTDYFQGNMIIANIDLESRTVTHVKNISGISSSWPNQSLMGFYKGALYYRGRTIA